MNFELLELKSKMTGLLEAELAIRTIRIQCEAEIEALEADIQKSLEEEIIADRIEQDREAIQEALSGCPNGGCDE